MRKLASIQRIRSLERIEGADVIEKATVLGWQLVVKKEEFKVGELCVYIEIDSVLPETAMFEFLRSKNFRIKTMKLRGQVSQGICFPLSILPAGTAIEEGMEVTGLLGIKKFEPLIPSSLSGLMKGNFPSFIPRTDETRVQLLEELLLEHAGRPCYITEKLDGTSATYFVKDGEFGVCSRNMELHREDRNIYWQMADTLDLERKLKRLGDNIAIQGELVGEQIQGNKLKLQGQQLFVFSVFLIDEYRYASLSRMKELAAQMDVQLAPVLDEDYALDAGIRNILEMAERNSVLCPEAKAEGIVIRVKDAKEHISFKVISNTFLLQYDE
ncbi:RNA ligase (ATP) [Taibaiella chishuiensis]|uniref:RNA ligase (TIGR02306 family) n=1 Tax=Taibaiella chishuiensis TaxID=1434707 RepID=A0A2P8DBL8_9BACT|nr:RNA ligase (ATP) [Taibaiella chishuiensis]PSK94609.1 RNA ligase (TIGR02306 family) [Taibaiella chishuiensis]